MTSMQLAQQVLSYSTLPQDPASIPADAAATIVNCINTGFSRYFIHAPSSRKTTFVSSYVQAPSAISATFTAGLSTFSGSGLSGSARIGDTLYIGSKKKVLAVGETLREPWDLASGSWTGTLYDDAVALADPIRRVEGSIIWNETRRLEYLSEAPIVEDQVKLINFSGEPQYFTLENLGDTIGGSARALLRIYPLPATSGTIRFTAQINPQRLSLFDLQSPVQIYINETDLDAFAMPFIIEELALTKYWPEKGDKNLASRASDKAEALLKAFQESTGGGSRVMTPANF